MPQALIEPHGGSLIDRVLVGPERQRALARSVGLKKVALSERSQADLECIATGIYSPLVGFVTEAQYESIVHDVRQIGRAHV